MKACTLCQPVIRHLGRKENRASDRVGGSRGKRKKGCLFTLSRTAEERKGRGKSEGNVDSYTAIIEEKESGESVTQAKKEKGDSSCLG